MTREEMERLTAHTDNKSEKIRILFREGAERSEIYKFLGITYQHVQNVLKRSGLLRKHADRENQSSDGTVVYTVTIDANGKITLPPEFVESEALTKGDTLICRDGKDGLTIMSRDAAADVLREAAKERMPGEAALLEALLDRNRSS